LMTTSSPSRRPCWPPWSPPRMLHCKKSPSPFLRSQPGRHLPNSLKPKICFPYEARSFPRYSLSQPGILTESF
jgi:hypothetical protein